MNNNDMFTGNVYCVVSERGCGDFDCVITERFGISLSEKQAKKQALKYSNCFIVIVDCEEMFYDDEGKWWIGCSGFKKIVKEASDTEIIYDFEYVEKFTESTLRDW